MEVKAQVLILLVVCVAIAICAKYCPEEKIKTCETPYRTNDCCLQKQCPSNAMCCKGRCGFVCKGAKDKPSNGVALKDGEKCKLGNVHPKTGLEWLFGEKT